jgi:hypothetical protein
MRRLIAFLVVLAFVFPAASAFAQSKDSVEKKFYIFGPHVVDGQVKGPKVEIYTDTGSSDFEPLRDLKRSFMPELRESTQAQALNE